MKKSDAAIIIVLSSLVSGCVAQEADLRQTEKVLQLRIKQQDEQLSQARARQSVELAALRDQDLPRLRGELEKALFQAQDLQAKQEDVAHRLALLEQQVKKLDADGTTRHAWFQKSFETQDTKVTAKLNELSRSMEGATVQLRKDIVEAIQRTNDTLAKRVDIRLDDQQKGTADNRLRLDQAWEKFAQFSQALTGFRDALTELNDQVEQGDQAVGKTLESLGQKITARLDAQDRRIEILAKAADKTVELVNQKPDSLRIDEQDRRIDILAKAMGKAVELANQKSDSPQQLSKEAPRSGDALPLDSEPAHSDRLKPEAGVATAARDGAEAGTSSVVMTPPKEMPVPESARGKAEYSDRIQYEHLLALFRNGDFEGARLGFTAFLSEYPNSELAPNARYWQGESYYGEREYQKAIESYDLVEVNYPRSEKVPAAMLKKGYAYLALKDKKRASSAFNQVLTLYPKSPEAGKASSKLAQIKDVR